MFLVIQIEQAKATAESDKLAAEMDLIQSRRRVEAFERELQELRNGGEIPEAVRIEVDRRLEVEQKLLAAEAKCSELMDKCDVRFIYYKSYSILVENLVQNRTWSSNFIRK